jgi:transposase
MKIDAVTFLPSMGSGGGDMVKADLWHEIHSRHKLKESKKAIARALGLHVQTVRNILRQAAPSPYQRERKGSQLLAPFLETIKNRLAAVGYCARSVYEEIKDQGAGPSWPARGSRPICSS